jgi:hypothetical protein
MIALMPELSDEQQSVLDALMVEGATAAERTEDALREQTGLAHVGRILRELENGFEEPLVQHELDAALGSQVWIATLAAYDLLDPEG